MDRIVTARRAPPTLAYAEGMADGPERPGDFERRLATRAELVRQAGRMVETSAAYTEAIVRARHPWEQEFLQRRMLAPTLR